MILEPKDNRSNDLILAISLGSKSSAMLTRSDGTIVAILIEESYTGIKNDSSFPINCITNLLNTLSKSNIYQLTVTLNHWFNSTNSNRTWDRYYTDIEKFINTVYKDYNIVVKRVIESNDLHNSLAETTKCYFESEYQTYIESNKDQPITILVSNRFGNFENVISIYKWKNIESFSNGEEPIIKKLKDFKSSISMMQQIASKMLGLFEYDPENGIMTYEQYEPIKKLPASKFKIYSNWKKWDEHDTYKDDVIYNNNKISCEEMIGRAIDKSNDIYDNRPINIKKIEQINAYYNALFEPMTDGEIIKYVHTFSYNALYNLIKPHTDRLVLLSGDSFVGKRIPRKLRNEFSENIIIDPIWFDNLSIIGSTNKILENIYYTSINMKNIHNENKIKQDENK